LCLAGPEWHWYDGDPSDVNIIFPRVCQKIMNIYHRNL
jgi:hypothetical protein